MTPAHATTQPGTTTSTASTPTGEPPANTKSFPERAIFMPWVDPAVDHHGHDPRSLYVEQFWLGVIGPTATWLLRRLVSRFDQHPDGYEIEIEPLARALGLSSVKGRRSSFGRALHRCVMFDVARPLSTGLVGWEVRRKLPDLPPRHLRRLPLELQQLHRQWHRTTRHPSSLARAHRLADAMVTSGDDPHLVETQLVNLGVAPEAASAICEKLLRAG